MVSLEFKKLYKQLNPAQKKAVDTVEGAVMVIAGPGTGKTQILTLRIANILLKTQVNPENVLALTFTENAAYEMRKRLLSIIGQDAYRVEITTFHSFCNNFIKNHREEFSHIIAASSINEIEQLQIIEECMTSLPLSILRPLGDLSYYLKPIASCINELKRENISPEVFAKALKDFEKELKDASDIYHDKGAHAGKMKSEYQRKSNDLEKNKELLLVFSAYQKKLVEKKKYDYNDMLLEVIKKFETHPYLLQYLQEKFQYFLVDEHQDTNAAQNKIVEMLCSYFDNPNLFVVGDEKQSIFRFQGATIENFLYFKNKYPTAVLINLSENYRSTKIILDSAFDLISNNPESTMVLKRQIRLVKRARHDEEEISLAKLSAQEIEHYWVADKIEKILQKNPDASVAVLARNNNDLSSLSPILENKNINYSVDSDSNILEDLDIQKLLLILRMVDDPTSNKFVSRSLLINCFSIHPLDAFKLIRIHRDEKISLWELLSDRKGLGKINLKSGKDIAAFVDLFTNKKNGLIKKSSNERFDRVFVDVMNSSGLMKSILQKNNAQEILSKFTRLYDIVKEEVGKNSAFSLSDFLAYIDLLEKHDISISQKNLMVSPGTVRLMTVHKSKGLEFDYVFIIKVFDTHWGNPRTRSSLFRIPWENLAVSLKKEISDDENVDERKLFYVALTRAKKKAFLSYSILSEDGREQIPSQFIPEIKKKKIVEEDVLSFEKELLSHRELLLQPASTNKKNGAIFSKDYVAEILRRQGLSVSALNNYLKCPWKFFFINLIRVPEKIDDPGLYGNAIHGALNQYILSLKKGKGGRELLLEKFYEELELQYITPKEMDRYKKRGEDALSGYYDYAVKDWSKDNETELEIKGIRVNDDLFLTGKIDMIVPKKNNTFDVYDFKTGKPKSRNEIEGATKTSNGNYKRQLVFYKLLLDLYKNMFFKMENGIVEFIEPSERSVYKREIFEITKEESDALLKQVIEVGHDILNLSFWDKFCEKKNCEYCKLRKFLN